MVNAVADRGGASNPRMREAVLWRANASELLELVPPEIARDAVIRHRKNLRTYRHYKDRFSMWESVVDVGPDIFQWKGKSGLTILTASGPIGFHTDPDFPRYGYLLILRDAGCRVVGAEDETHGHDSPGDLICLNLHRLHALAGLSLDQERLGLNDPDGGNLYFDRPYPRIWCAISLECDRKLSPKTAKARMLKSLQKGNRHVTYMQQLMSSRENCQ